MLLYNFSINAPWLRPGSSKGTAFGGARGISVARGMWVNWAALLSKRGEDKVTSFESMRVVGTDVPTITPDTVMQPEHAVSGGLVGTVTPIAKNISHSPMRQILILTLPRATYSAELFTVCYCGTTCGMRWRCRRRRR